MVLTDPDAPSRENPEWSEVCHWIGKVNVSKVDEDGEVDLSVRSGEVEDVIECTYLCSPLFIRCSCCELLGNWLIY